MPKKKYIVTNSCYHYGTKKRHPHFIEVVDLKTGEVKQIKSGSIISLIKERK